MNSSCTMRTRSNVIVMVAITALLFGCATVAPQKDATFRLEKLTVVERSDGTTAEVRREFKRVSQAEFDLLTEAEKIAWKLLKKQIGL
jgi:hypothetical protein